MHDVVKNSDLIGQIQNRSQTKQVRSQVIRYKSQYKDRRQESSRRDTKWGVRTRMSIY